MDIHAATQDFRVWIFFGTVDRVFSFDTELGARLAVLDGLNLGAVVKSFWGHKLEKSIPKNDWSQRPLQSLG